MSVFRTYIQPLLFDGRTYTQGNVVDLLNTYKVACQEFPFKKFPKPKDLPSRDWSGDDGLDVYVPSTLPMKEYDMEVTFIYVGTELSIRADLSNFIDFLYGRNTVASGVVRGARLAVYDEHVGMGRKDVVVSEVENTLFHLVPGFDSDAIAQFKVKFTVYDPVTPVTANYTNGVCTSLSF